MLRGVTSGAVAALLCLSAAAAAAPAHRFALLIANNEGGPDTEALHYAEADADKVRGVLTELGGYRREDVVLLRGARAEQALAALDALEMRVRALPEGTESSLLVYYSGHAKVGDLQMGRTRLDLGDLRRRLVASEADVRIGIVDACESGALTRAKGGRRGPSFLFDTGDEEAARGLILISSSSENETSQESDELGGSFFTHYLTSGLRGDADGSGDARVTLAEAYEYTYHKTVATTASTRSGVQHPTYSFDLRGQGDIVLTDLSRGDAGVAFGADLEGRFLVFDLGRDRVAAEIDKRPGAGRRIALPPGTYAVKRRMTDHVRLARFTLASNATYEVQASRMSRYAFEDDYAKGSRLVARLRRERTRFAVEGTIAYQSFLSSAARRELVPALPLYGVSTRVGPILGGADLQVDLLFGRRSGALLDLGALAVQQDFFQAEIGVGLLWRLRLGSFSVAAGPRLAALYFRRGFPSDPVLLDRTQDMLGLSPALAAETAYYFGADDTVSLALFGRSGVLLYSVDDNRALGYLEGGLTLGVRL